jgi:glyceraldehyde 3-phosphate dehydrogenase
MTIKLGINGFGRIGRSVFRIAREHADVEVVAVNDTSDPKTLAYLVKYDTVHGRLDADVSLEGQHLKVGGKSTKMLSAARPEDCPWKELGVDVVVECTGRFKTRTDLERHVAAGAKRVILAMPDGDDPLDSTVILGVNERSLNADQRLVSIASCTANCLAPLAKVLQDAFGIDRAFMTTVHAYTNDQRLAEVPDQTDLRRSRAAAENIILTTTAAPRAVARVMPTLAGRIDGTAMRVPVPDGSIVDLVAELACDVTRDEVLAALEAAAKGPMKGILGFSREPIVSSDIIGNSHSCVVDVELTQMTGNRMVRLVAWYDNEWGFSSRVVDLAVRMGAFEKPPTPSKK